MMQNRKQHMEASAADETCRKKRKVDTQDKAETVSGVKIVATEAITRLNNFMYPRYWSVGRIGINFVMKVNHNGQIFEGQGYTLQKAKQDAAKHALRAHVQDENALNAHKDPVTQLNELSIDKYWLAYQDGPNIVMGVEHKGQIFHGQGRTMQAAKRDTAVNALRSLLDPQFAPKACKNALMQLDKHKPCAKYSMTYLTIVEVNGEQYPGQGHTEMEAKSNAAEKALKVLGLSTNTEVLQPQASNSTQHSTPPDEATKDKDMSADFSSYGSQDPGSSKDSADVILIECDDKDKHLDTSHLPITLTKSSGHDSDVVVMEPVISIRCPITWKVMTDPVKNRYCGHLYEKEAAYQLINNRGNAAWCPMAGCKCTLNKEFLVSDDHLKKLIVAKTRSS